MPNFRNVSNISDLTTMYPLDMTIMSPLYITINSSHDVNVSPSYDNNLHNADFAPLFSRDICSRLPVSSAAAAWARESPEVV